MEEKILAKGVFSKFNFISGIFLALSLFGVFGLFASFDNNAQLVDSTGITIGFLFILLGLGGAFLFYHLLNKCDIVVTDKRVYGKAAFNHRVDLPLDKISSIDTCSLHGIGVATSSGKIKFLFCQNQSEIFDTISKLLLERQKNKQSVPTVQQHEAATGNADELKKYKDLLDSGVLTQEEFDAKKKQLLGL